MLRLNYENINYVMTQILKLSCASFSYVNISYVLAHCLDLDLNGKRTGIASDGNFSSYLIRRSGFDQKLCNKMSLRTRKKKSRIIHGVSFKDWIYCFLYSMFNINIHILKAN